MRVTGIVRATMREQSRKQGRPHPWPSGTFSSLRKICCCLVTKFVSDSFATPGTVALQAPLYIQFSRQEYWSGLPFPSAGDLPGPGIEPTSLSWQTDSSPLSHLGSPVRKRMKSRNCINKKIKKAIAHCDVFLWKKQIPVVTTNFRSLRAVFYYSDAD